MTSVWLIVAGIVAGASASTRTGAGSTLHRSSSLIPSRPRMTRDLNVRVPQVLRSMFDSVLGRRTRSEQRLVAALPEAIDVVSRSLRSGSSVSQALAHAAAATQGPLGAALDRIVNGMQRGESVSQALQRFAARSSGAEVRVSVAALTMAAEAGGGPSRALDGVSESLRDRQRLGREIGALTSQARMSAIVLISLPVVFVAVYAAVDASALAFLLQDDLGRLCLVLGIGLDVIGWLWMRQLVRQVRA